MENGWQKKEIFAALSSNDPLQFLLTRQNKRGLDCVNLKGAERDRKRID